ncbi:hypothetical protein [Sphingorhabdus sp.]|uniref:hypothetical protein n=1 Tax=Sphingorhabdus sp. TaxID=1902408 RepID=UPI003341DAC8
MRRPDSFREIEAVTGADAVPTLSIFDALKRRESPVALFTPALLFTQSEFDKDPVVEFDARFPADSADLRPFCVALSKPHEFFFHGMGTCPAPGKRRAVNWDKMLYCIDQTRAEECFAFLGGIAFSNPKTGVFAQTFSQEVNVVDPTSFGNATLSVTVFGVMTNIYTVFMSDKSVTPTVRKINLSMQHKIPRAILLAGMRSGFTGDDPITMRDE